MAFGAAVPFCSALGWATGDGLAHLAILLASWKLASLLVLDRESWRGLTWWRLLAYGVWPGMQPRQFVAGAISPPGAPLPTFRAFLFDVVATAALFVLATRLLPASTPRTVRIGVGLVGLGFLVGARLEVAGLIFRWLGFAVEKAWVWPFAATSLGEFWGRRWNRIVSGFLREVVFVPLARRAGARPALLVVYLYSGLYHEIVSAWRCPVSAARPSIFRPSSSGSGPSRARSGSAAPGPPLAGTGLDPRRGDRAARIVPPSRPGQPSPGPDADGGRSGRVGALRRRRAPSPG